MAKKIGRREFVKRTAQISFSAMIGGSVLSQFSCSPAAKCDIAVASGSDYLNNTSRAVELLGGMEKFVKNGSKVAILPNTQSRHTGSYTKPDIVRAVIRMCKAAGAAEVNCLSWLTPKHWADTGLDKAVKEEGANLRIIDRDDESLYQSVPVPKGVALKEAQIMKEFFNNDVLIDMPITKDHAGNKFTGTMKNLMALNFRVNNRTFHKENWTTDQSAIEHLDQCIADLNTVIEPDLCVVDATEFITTNGPFGPGKLIKPQKVIAGKDRVAIDAYCANLWGLEAKDIIMINKAYEHQLGQIDLQKVKIEEVTV
ncbi:MAG: DUF362 domain-containing protein [Candidatus Aminicenantes bacterium]|nr:MAG: DUF362 domain-containing protein [Candidatus Aminicenantes bacterium]